MYIFINKVGYRLGYLRYRCQIDTIKIVPVPKQCLIGLNDLENNLIAKTIFYQYCDCDLISDFFLKLFIFIINQRHAINHCIVCMYSWWVFV